jgi:LysW-gamma-L-lysine carboxypeptidase
MDDVEVLRALLEVYSPSGEEGFAVHRFLELARDLGLNGHSDLAGNAIAQIGRGPPTILFLGHIDTVDGALPVRLEDGRLYGRGACDAKGPLAAALIAASHHRGPGEIIIIGAVGEERDSRGTRELLTYHPAPDFLIVGEPSGWDSVTIGYKGNLSLRLRLDGERTHLSGPEPTTVERGLALIDRLRAFCSAREGGTPFVSPTMKVSSFHTLLNEGKEHVQIVVNLRLPPGFPAGDVLALLELEGDVRWDILDRSDAVEVDSKNPVVSALCAGIREQRERPTLLRKLGTSDLNLAAPAWGCPSAAYGPGDSHLDHTDRENLPVLDFQRAIVVLGTAFSRLGSTSSAKISVAAGTTV